jgi:hypothetical protein
MLLEPLLYSPEARKIKAGPRVSRAGAGKKGALDAADDKVRYIPYFMFNDRHLWYVARTKEHAGFDSFVRRRRFWKKFNPAFATSVHNQIFDSALKGMPWADLQWVKLHSLAVDGPLGYDPRDHFDNAFIDAGWTLVQQRLASKNLTDFATAVHAIGDFYAHSSYAHFAPRNPASGALVLYSPAATAGLKCNYGTAVFDLHDTARFSTNERRCTSASRDAIIGKWNGQIISGRFAQPRDQHPGSFSAERNLFYIPNALLANTRDFAPRYCLPHHDEIAVDHALASAQVPDGHTLYRTPKEYSDQYTLRVDAAVRHVKEVYEAWKGVG